MDWAGRLIDGRYVVEGVVGSGGMGVVLAARHKFTGARVALKMVRKDLGLDPDISARFLAEARVPAAIDHRGVVKTLDAGKTPEGELYLVMELLAGRSLRAEMQLAPPPLVAVRRIGMELLDVLAAAHARGVIHRDIKPENVFLVSPGPEVNSGPSVLGPGAQVKLLDFGITKLLTSGHSVLPRTQAGAMLGTAAYMAPEQLADARTVDARADLWAVGIMLYELIGGRRPFRGATIEELLVQLVRGEPDSIRAAYPQATPDLEAFFARALAKDPNQRFGSASEMAQAFARLSIWPPMSTPASGLPPVATPPAGVPGLPASTLSLATGGSTEQIRHVGRSPWLLVLAGVLAVAAGAGVVFFAMKRSDRSAQAPAPVAAVAASPADAASASPAPSDAALVAATGSASKPARTVARGSTSSGGPAPIDPYAAVPDAGGVSAGDPFCSASCKMLDACHLGSRSCETDCARNPAVHQCLAGANGDCNAFASCMFAGYCSHIPVGGHSCSAAMDCETSCQGNQVCVCTCIQGLAPTHAAALLGLRGCAAPCRGDTACIAKNCDAQIRRCRAQ